MTMIVKIRLSLGRLCISVRPTTKRCLRTPGTKCNALRMLGEEEKPGDGTKRWPNCSIGRRGGGRESTKVGSSSTEESKFKQGITNLQLDLFTQSPAGSQIGVIHVSRDLAPIDLTYCHVILLKSLYHPSTKECLLTIDFQANCRQSLYRVIHKSLRDFQPLRYSSRDGHAEGEHVNRGRDTPSFCPTLQVLDMSTLGVAADVNPVIKFLPHTCNVCGKIRNPGGAYESPCITVLTVL